MWKSLCEEGKTSYSEVGFAPTASYEGTYAMNV